MRKSLLRRPLDEDDPGPARPITYVFVAVLAVVMFLVAYGMARHHFLRSGRWNYYHEHVKTPWHF